MVEGQARPARNLTRPAKARCCCYYGLGVSILVTTLVVIVLVFTVFKVREPNMTLNKITLDNGPGPGLVLQPGTNISLTADVSVKNPNPATFRFSSSTVGIYYGGILVGEARGPSGRAGPRGTVRMNVTGAIMTDRVMAGPTLRKDIGSGLFGMDSHTRVPGKVKVLVVVKRKVVVEMNCTISFNITSQVIQDQKCKRHVYF